MRPLRRPQSIHFGHVYQLCLGGHLMDWNLADLVVRNRGQRFGNSCRSGA